MKTRTLSAALACLVAAVVPLTQAAGPNIVIFIGDGMGFEHVQAGRLYRTGRDAMPLTFETLLYHLNPASKLIGEGGPGLY